MSFLSTSFISSDSRRPAGDPLAASAGLGQAQAESALSPHLKSRPGTALTRENHTVAEAVRLSRPRIGETLTRSATTARWTGHSRWNFSALILLAVASLGTGCTSLKHRAVDTLGDALAAGGTTFAADDDPQLVAAAVPFSLKLMESLLAERPQHRGLLLAAASGFTQYAFAFVQQDADEVTEKDFAAGTVLKHRARRLYLRARDYGLRGLDLAHPAFSAKLRADPRTAVRLATKADVPLLYWTAASWGAAIALSKDNADLIADQGILEALIDRAHELDADYDQGAIHALLVTYEMARPGGAGDAATRSRRHFDRALALSGGQQAGLFVSLAESVALPQQNRAEFEALLKRALAIDVDARPEFRLVNLVMQRRARWLLGRIDDLFLPAAEPAPAPSTAMFQQPGMQAVTRNGSAGTQPSPKASAGRQPRPTFRLPRYG